MAEAGPNTIHCRIYQPPKSSMQSGRAKTHAWILEYEASTKRYAEPLMGWTASDDTLNQVRLSFKTQDDAIAFAQKEGFDYSVEQPKAHRVKPRSYLDNFRYIPPKPAAG
jgi:hypothetical protein